MHSYFLPAAFCLLYSGYSPCPLRLTPHGITVVKNLPKPSACGNGEIKSERQPSSKVIAHLTYTYKIHTIV
jgi:hypothetical protein